MDVNDRVGDAADGITTLPILLGLPATLGVSRALLAGCAAVGLRAALWGRGLGWLWAMAPTLAPLVRGLAAASGLAVVMSPAVAVARAARRGFSPEEVSRVVNLTMHATTAGVILITLLS